MKKVAFVFIILTGIIFTSCSKAEHKIEYGKDSRTNLCFAYEKTITGVSITCVPENEKVLGLISKEGSRMLEKEIKYIRDKKTGICFATSDNYTVVIAVVPSTPEVIKMITQ